MSALLVVLGLLLSGCANGYTAASLYPDDIRSVAVPIFENRTFHTGVEREVTDAVIKELQHRTPYIVTSSDQADTILTGRIVSVQKTMLNRATGVGLVRETLLSVTVDFRWTNRRSGLTLVERRNFRFGDEFVPSRPFLEHPDVGEFAVADGLAREIVATLRGEW